MSGFKQGPRHHRDTFGDEAVEDITLGQKRADPEAFPGEYAPEFMNKQFVDKGAATGPTKADRVRGSRAQLTNGEGKR